MPTMPRVLLPVCLLAVACAPASAQSEPEVVLKDFFEGKSVVVKLDMPATQEGIELITADFVEGVLVKYSISSK